MKYTCLVILFLSFSAYAQKTIIKPQKLPYILYEPNQIKIQLKQNVENNALALAEYYSDNYLKSTPVTLLPAFKKTSLSATHYTYYVYVNSIKVYKAYVKISFNKTKQTLVVSSFIPQSENNFEYKTIDLSNALLVLKNTESLDSLFTETVLVVKNDSSRLMLMGRIRKINQTSYDVLINQSGVIVSENSIDAYHQKTGPNDSIVSLNVYTPDPLTMAGVTYGGNYIDLNDQNKSVLNPLIVSKFITAYFDQSNGVFKLKNDFVEIMEFSAPVNPVVTSSNPEFLYGRSHYGFEQCNALFHITKMQTFIKSLGFSDLVNYPIQVDAQAMNGQDNSMFSFNSTVPRLFFGIGGVDDAEDADVIVHEYGHAISYDAAPGTNEGTERKTLDEANGDYLAASYSKTYSTFNYKNIFSWDGWNEFWDGRSANATGKYYPNLNFNDIYSNTDIWANSLLDIEDKIGRNTTSTLLFESMYSYFPNMTYPNAAMLIVEADSALNNGINVPDIWRIFNGWGILPNNTVSINEHLKETWYSIVGTQNFAIGQSLTLILKEKVEGQYQLLDINGNILESNTISQMRKVDLSSSKLKAGVYILVLNTKNNQPVVQKLMRF